MNAPNRPPGPWIHPDFRKNQAQFPAAELWKYGGQQAAWSWDGTKIVAAAPTHEELFAKLDAMGIPTDTVVFEFIPDPDVSYL